MRRYVKDIVKHQQTALLMQQEFREFTVLTVSLISEDYQY